MIKTNVDYQSHNQPDIFPEVWCEMLDSLSYSVELLVESYTIIMIISIF